LCLYLFALGIGNFGTGSKFTGFLLDIVGINGIDKVADDVA
jgi:hypothetical protein